MVAILQPYEEIVSSPFEIKYTCANIRSLIEQIRSIEGESRIVMEHTGRYYEPLARELSQASEPMNKKAFQLPNVAHLPSERPYFRSWTVSSRQNLRMTLYMHL